MTPKTLAALILTLVMLGMTMGCDAAIGDGAAENASIPAQGAAAYFEIVKNIQSYPLVDHDYYGDGPRNWVDYWSFAVALYDITGDGIPELFCTWMPEVENETAMLSIWTYQDGQAQQLFSEYVSYLGPGDVSDYIDTIFISADKGLYWGARNAGYDGALYHNVFRRYAYADGALRLTDMIDMAFDQEVFDRDLAADEVGGSIYEYMYPCHNGTRLTSDAFQSFSESAFNSIEVILFGDSLGEPNAAMSCADAITLLEGESP